MPLALVFRVFAAILGLLGAINVLILVLADPIARYSPVEMRAMGSLSEALLLFGVQLVLNLGWSWLFFGQQQIGWAVAEIGLLWLAIAACIFTFARHDRIAAWLLLPYLLWVSFAVYLTFAIWLLNPV